MRAYFCHFIEGFVVYTLTTLTKYTLAKQTVLTSFHAIKIKTNVRMGEPVRLVMPVRLAKVVRLVKPVRLMKPVKLVKPVRLMEPVRLLEPNIPCNKNLNNYENEMVFDRLSATNL